MEQEKNQLTTQSGNSLANNYLNKVLREYPKIRSLKNFVPIEQALARCFILVGIPAASYPKGDEKNVLIDHICKSYPGYVAPEIIKAFEMAVNREYHEVDYDVLLKHYGTFSAEYLGRIMTVYTDQHRNKILSLTANVTPLYKQPEFDELANYELGFFRKFDKFKETKEFDFIPVTAAFYYDQLKGMGLIDNSKDERQAFWDIIRERTSLLRDKRGKIIETTKDHNKRMITLTKSMMLHEWFKGEAMSDTDIRLLISPLLNRK